VTTKASKAAYEGLLLRRLLLLLLQRWRAPAANTAELAQGLH
jgi:hypothetical protein